jgi:D-glycero-D-manno-heptose 1,7-bisphosphate phosphatase
MEKAVFLDRDGVINRLVFNPQTGEFESPHQAQDLVFYPWTLASLKALLLKGYLLFLVSNQPSYAKGKTTMENIKSIHKLMHQTFRENKIDFAEYYYCYHHPKGIVSDLTCICQCRKPGTLFLQQAAKKYKVDIANSWMVGDRETDILCGNSFGLKTIWVNKSGRSGHSKKCQPDFVTTNLKHAVGIITKSEK